MNPVHLFSYQDHDATVIKVKDTYYRNIYHPYKVAYDHLMESGLQSGNYSYLKNYERSLKNHLRIDL